MITQQWPKGDRRISEKVILMQFSSRARHFSANPCEPKMAKYSPVGPHRGTDLGNLEIAPGTPVIGQGVRMEEKEEWDVGPNRRTVAATDQTKF